MTVDAAQLHPVLDEHFPGRVLRFEWEPPGAFALYDREHQLVAWYDLEIIAMALRDDVGALELILMEIDRSDREHAKSR